MQIYLKSYYFTKPIYLAIVSIRNNHLYAILLYLSIPPFPPQHFSLRLLELRWIPESICLLQFLPDLSGFTAPV